MKNCLLNSFILKYFNTFLVEELKYISLNDLGADKINMTSGSIERMECFELLQ